MSKEIWTVWVGGSEVNDHYLTLDEAKMVQESWLLHGYDDVHIRSITSDRNTNRGETK
jgi:hypothetical protein